MKHLYYYLFAFCTLLLFHSSAIAQDVTRVSGQIIDAETGEFLPFVDVGFVETAVGTSTDIDGKFEIVTRFAAKELTVAFIGYEQQKIPIVMGEANRNLKIRLKPEGLQFETVTVKAKRKKYSRKNNPAVDLYRDILAKKKENSIKNEPYYTYNTYERLELDLNNLSDKFRNRKLWKKMDFVFDHIDTSKINGKPFLPIYLRETYAKVAWEKSSETEKEERQAIKSTEFQDFLDPGSLNDIMDILYENVDIFDSHVKLLGNEFISPISDLGYTFYRYYILDTVQIEGKSHLQLSFLPKNKQDFGFVGELFVVNDSTYNIKSIEMGISGDINLNFVRDIRIMQEFEKRDKYYVIKQNDVLVDFALNEKGVGVFGKRKVSYTNLTFDEPEDKSIFGAVEAVIEAPDQDKPLEYWNTIRLENRDAAISTDKNDAETIYAMVDRLDNAPPFKRFKSIIKIISTGYIPAGPVDIGKYATFISFNAVEGARWKFGGENNYKVSSNWRIAPYVAYGTRDKRFKYGVDGLWSFNQDYKENPRHYLKFSYNKDLVFPGLGLDFASGDNLFVSIRRGIADKLLFNRRYRMEYKKEGSYFDYGFSLDRNQREAAGSLSFTRQGENGEIETVPDITTLEVGANFRFAPNQQFIQGRTYRRPLINKYPVFTFDYGYNLPSGLGADYGYHRIEASAFKRFYLGNFGFSDITMKGGKLFGSDIPYVISLIPQANQTYNYVLSAYNTMDFLEFATDRYAALWLEHHFQGWLFNKIPLIRKLKLRGGVTTKALWGKMGSANDPNLDPTRIQFTKREVNGELVNETTVLNNKPFLESSFSIMNIFKILRIEIIQRWTYKDNPVAPENLFGREGLGLRGTVWIEF